MTGIGLIIVFIFAIALMIFCISKLKIHPFLAIMAISLVFGLIAGIPLVNTTDADGNTVTDMRYEGYRIYAGKPSIGPLPPLYLNSESEADTLEIDMADKVTGMRVTLIYTAFNSLDVIIRSARIENASNRPADIDRAMSICVDLPGMDYDLITLYGRHCKERSEERRPLAHGLQGIASKRGVSSHCQNPFAALVSKNAGEDSGEAYGFNLVYSGNFEFCTECDYSGTSRILMGINPTDFTWHLEPGESFQTPETVMVHTSKGIGEMSRIYHKLYNFNLVPGKYRTEKRPLLINSWEAAFFDFDTDKLVSFAERAKEFGMDMLVMDDGWFGDKYPRNNGTSSLGDWVVCKEKLPEGIEGLTASAREKGLKFGIWIEPEMTNTRSELYEKHPDWVIQQPYRENRKGRGGTQQVLDLSNPAVQEFVFGVVDRLMTAHPDIAYIKWDDNMTLYNYGSTFLPADRQSHLYIEYHRGMDKVLRRIREKYPRLVMQSCASGGGRVNYGVLPYYDEFWTSDNTDALQRIYMQWGVSNFYPAVAMASHVSASPNHQTGRNVPLKLRFDVAMSGRLGLELQPSKMTGKEKEFARRAIADYKEIRPIVQQGDLYRLISPYDKTGYASLMYVAPEKDRAVWFVYKLEHFLNMPSPAFRMAGLDPGKRYRITELNVDGKPVPQDGKTFSGAFLMENGLEFTVGKEYASRVLELKAVE